MNFGDGHYSRDVRRGRLDGGDLSLDRVVPVRLYRSVVPAAMKTTNHVTKPAVTNKIAAREWGFVHLPHD